MYQLNYYIYHLSGLRHHYRRILILDHYIYIYIYIYIFSHFPTVVKHSVLAAVRARCVDSISETTKVTKRYLSNKITGAIDSDIAVFSKLFLFVYPFWLRKITTDPLVLANVIIMSG